NSPNIAKVDVVRKGKVRRAKLYYLRDKKGKDAKVAERDYSPIGKRKKAATNVAPVAQEPQEPQEPETAVEK
ncbi:MAG: 50S ribosomal protein L19, partial [Nitrospirota bacterium]|nr:50S ribosomal protein L19 [Nitrospirota bacterium]